MLTADIQQTQSNISSVRESEAGGKRSQEHALVGAET